MDKLVNVFTTERGSNETRLASQKAEDQIEACSNMVMVIPNTHHGNQGGGGVYLGSTVMGHSSPTSSKIYDNLHLLVMNLGKLPSWKILVKSLDIICYWQTHLWS